MIWPKTSSKTLRWLSQDNDWGENQAPGCSIDIDGAVALPQGHQEVVLSLFSYGIPSQELQKALQRAGLVAGTQGTWQWHSHHAVPAALTDRSQELQTTGPFCLAQDLLWKKHLSLTLLTALAGPVSWPRTQRGEVVRLWKQVPVSTKGWKVQQQDRRIRGLT